MENINKNGFKAFLAKKRHCFFLQNGMGLMRWGPWPKGCLPPS